MAGPNIVGYFSNHILGHDSLKESVADCATTKESIRIGFKTKDADETLELHLRIIRLYKYQPVRRHLSHKPRIA